ncbi:MAG: energy-coupling factor transporter transmembrane protein EcfT [Methanobacteriota archaeon]|nr:MAG: energy-coupling factor transporter transmembrane protein EcfT [Euryarchaeota archaeon]
MTEAYDNRMRGVNPLAKLGILITLSALVLLLGTPLTMLLMLVAVISAKQYFGTKGRFTKGVMGFALAIFVAQILFNHSGDRLASAWIIEVTNGGVTAGVTIAGKFLCLIMMSWIFVSTTRPSEFSSSLVSSGLPYRYAYLPALAMRFVPVFEVELNSVREAQTVRGLRLDRSVKGLLRAAKYTIVPMFFVAMFKVDSLAASMTGRGFGLHKDRTDLHPVKTSPWDIAAVVATIAVAIVLFQIDRCVEVPALLSA